MDSSNAEKAWLVIPGQPVYATRGEAEAWLSGRASRDAEVAELTRLLAESRARFGDSEARRAELEAVIGEALAVEDKHPDTAFYVIVGHMRAALVKAPSVVLEDRDREVAARAVEAVARDLAEPAVLWWSNFYGPQVCTDEAAGAKLSLDDWFAQRAAAIRKGDTNA